MQQARVETGEIVTLSLQTKGVRLGVASKPATAPPRSPRRHIDDIPVADALSIYLDAQLTSFAIVSLSTAKAKIPSPLLGSGPTRHARRAFCRPCRTWFLVRQRRLDGRLILPCAILVEAGAVCARAILEKRRDDLDAGVPLLIARETLTAEEFAPLRPVAVQEIEKATE